MKTCLVCNNPAHAGGYCGKHYARWKRHGNPLSISRAENGVADEFYFATVVKCESHECLIWPFWRNSFGYGMLRVGDKDRLVSRLVCEYINGAPPTPKHEAAHSCGNGNRGCVNPQHLSWKTRKENNADRLIHGTHNRGERQGASRLTKADIIEIRNIRMRTHADIASLYGVSQSHITRIINRQAWGWPD